MTEDRGQRTRDPGRRTSDFASSRQPRYHASTVEDRPVRMIASRWWMACRNRPRCGREPAPTKLPVLTTIKQIRALSQDEGARGYPVRVRGTVTHFDEQHDVTLMIHDGEFGQFVATPKVPGSVGTWHGLRRGDVVQIEGRTVRGGFAPNIQPTSVRKLGQKALPTPKRIPFASMLSGRHDCDYVEVTGVIQRAWASSNQEHTLFAEVAVEDGVVRAAFLGLRRQDVHGLKSTTREASRKSRRLFGRTEQLRRVVFRRADERHHGAGIGARSVVAAVPAHPEHLQLLGRRRSQPPDPRTRRRHLLHSR